MSTKTKIMPLRDRVLVRPDTETEATQTKSGIYLPGAGDKERANRGTVVAVGGGRTLDDGTAVPVAVKAGDTVVFSQYSADEIKVDDEKYLIVREDNILAIVK